MASRGATTKNGHVTTSEYKLVKEICGMKILTGTTTAHGLPDFSHTPNRIYVKENKDGSLREMRFFGDDCYPVLEFGYHPEPGITGNRHDKVLHYHIFGKNLSRSKAAALTKELIKKYRKFLEVYGL